MMPDDFAADSRMRLQRLRALFEHALEIDPDRRSDWLGHACAGDLALCKEVEDLLAADSLAHRGLVPPIFAITAPAAPALPRLEGRLIGGYEIVREIAHGGMGAVYLARRADRAFSKDVAFKVVRPERSDPELLRRFRREREIVARLEHPNIARLIDGGTTGEGLPYFVMEYIEGRPIDIHCDENRLSITERLNLFRTVCSAVHYAHQNLVIHRDLKPSNIMVTADGTVKLLDFGIAKLLRTELDETIEQTAFGVKLLTPAYASPEQIRGEPVSTSSDVYSLGVVLYELLTGRRPYDMRRGNPHAIMQAICEQPAERPSAVVLRDTNQLDAFGRTVYVKAEHVGAVREGKPVKLARRLSGDLDNILLMALRKEPQRRYSSVEQFSEDLRRHINGVPVTARIDTLLYRTGKFIRRHRALVGAAVLVFLMLVAATAVTSWQAQIARLERAHAENQTREANFQKQRAEQQTREAEFHKQRAEREATFAKQQLALAERRRREAELEREKAKRNARDAHAISARMLELNGDVAESPAGLEAGQRLADAVVETLSRLASTGYFDPSLSSDLASARGKVQKYEELRAGIHSGPPDAWQFDTTSEDNFECGTDKTEVAAGTTAYIRSRRGDARGYAKLYQLIDAEPYAGKRVRLSASLRSKSLENHGGLFLSTFETNDSSDSQGNHFSLRTPLRGTNGWGRHQIVADVSAETVWLKFGFSLTDGGSIWADNFIVEIVDASTPLTDQSVSAPADLNFEGGR
jgi:serine/threonine protein kinase